MINQDIYQRNPATLKILNHGVAYVDEEKNSERMAVLRYELETFVCDGEYKKGLERILETYLKNIESAEQPGVWISGFYGSGKSHLVNVLRALWADTVFEDGATARGIAILPQSIKDHLKELSIQSKRHGGLHTASGTLGSGAGGSVRLALLRIIFKSVDLPEQYPIARFVMWLKNAGIYDTVRHLVEQSGRNWNEELDNFYVAEGLHEALVKVKPNLFPSTDVCINILNNEYAHIKDDVSIDEMIKAILQALSRDDKFPLTLVALDEVQQYIGDDSNRSLAVQEVVEACCKRIGGKLLFIGTGQMALSGTANLKKLEGRFTVPVPLRDADVDEVIRQVILAKKPQSVAAINQVLQENLGEISRHLTGTTISHVPEDISDFAQDYPILPVRRRFWENTFRILDKSGTASQLRNELLMVHNATRSNLDKPLGNVIPADYLYFDSADKYLQAGILPRKVYEKTLSWKNGSEDERLMGRACGLVFLINKLASSNKEIGLKATVNTLADLMVEDLPQGSSALRSKLPDILSKCDLLMKVDDEYRIQTKESAAWTEEFQNQYNTIANTTYRIDSERDDRIKAQFTKLGKLSLIVGNSKVSREIEPFFDAQLPADHDKKVYVWVRNGWSIQQNSVHAEALQAGNQSPTIFVFLPKKSADELRHNIIEYKASMATLEIRGVPHSAEGIEARQSMNTTFESANSKIEELIAEIFADAHVYQGGGNEILGTTATTLHDNVLKAAENALRRLYPQFDVADHPGWATVYLHAKQGSPEALKAVNFVDKPEENPVCKLILAFIAGGKKGTDIRTKFEESPFGWSRDAIDGGLQVLLVADLVLAQDEHGQRIDPKTLDRKTIGKTTFKVESTIVTTEQKIQIRKLFLKTGVNVKTGEEHEKTPEFLVKMFAKAESSGGDAPRPPRPDKSLLEEIRLSAGNEQLIAIYTNRDKLGESYDEWDKLAAGIEEKILLWNDLLRLLRYGDEIKETQEATQQAQFIENKRLLLYVPDMILPLVRSTEKALRKELMDCFQRYKSELERQMKLLEADAYWQKLPEETRNIIANKCGIETAKEPKVGTRQELIETLDIQPLNAWKDRIDAIGEHFARARELAAKEFEPKTRSIDLPRRLLKTNEDLETWMQEVEKKLKEALTKGPIVLR